MKKLLGLFLLGTSVWAFALTPREILKRAEEGRGPEGIFSFSVKATEYQGKKTIRSTVYKVYSKDGKYSLVETIFPERLQGRKLLMRDNGLWLYLPTINRPTRVSLQQRLTGEVSNGDLARTNFYEDYEPKLLANKAIDGKDCYQLGLTAKKNDLAYQSLSLFVDVKTLLPVRAEFHALSGKLLKIGEYSDFKRVFGKTRATKVTIKDALQLSRHTVLAYSKYKKEALSDAFFNKETLIE